MITIVFWKGKDNGGSLKKSVHQSLIEQVEESNDSEMHTSNEKTSNECDDIEQKPIEVAAKFSVETSTGTYHVLENTEYSQMMDFSAETSVGHSPENSKNGEIVVELPDETSTANHTSNLPKDTEIVKIVYETTTSHVLENLKDAETSKLSDEMSTSHLSEKAKLQAFESTIPTRISSGYEEKKNANIEFCYQDKAGNIFLLNNANDTEEEKDSLVPNNNIENEIIQQTSSGGDSIKCIQFIVNGQENSLPVNSLESVNEQHS